MRERNSVQTLDLNRNKIETVKHGGRRFDGSAHYASRCVDSRELRLKDGADVPRTQSRRYRQH